jgi:6-phosphogluconolactonase (cycloisomerase 2 family)
MFATKLAAGTAYAVSVLTQPTGPSQTCSVTNASGAVSTSDVTNIAVSCTTKTYGVGGTVTGLSGSGLVLRDDGGDDLSVSGNGAFSFATAVASGAAYSVIVSTQPTNPVQNCTVTNGTGSGTVDNTNVTSVEVTCAAIGRFAYVANDGDDTISAYAINAVSGALTPVAGSPFPSKRAEGLAVDPGGQFLYTANFDSTGVSAYTIDKTTGALTEVTGSPFAAGVAPLSVTVDPSGRFVYVANANSYDVSAFTINSSTGALTAIPGSPFAAGSIPSWVTVDPAGQFVYVTNSDVANNISGYTIDQTTGALTALATGPFPTGAQPSSIAVDPSGNYAYVANDVSSNVSAYSINRATGALTALAASPYAAGTNPTSVTVDVSGTFVYVANTMGIGGQGGNNVSAYTINANTGALTPVAGSPFATGMSPFCVTTDPSGKFLYVASETTGIWAFAIDPTSGALAPVPGSPFPAGHNSNHIVVSR